MVSDFSRIITLLRKEKGVTQKQAAEDLVQVARANDFTLFEFFLTDLAGHSRSYETACKTLSMLDEFIDVVAALCQATNMLLILTSDHGNLENLENRSHTFNPVPFIAIGPGSDDLRRNITNLVEVTPQILRILNRA